MGFLTSILGFGSAGTAASASQGFGILGAGLSAAGDISSGFGQGQQYMYQAAVAQNNADVMRQNAQNAVLQGSSGEISSKMKYGALENTQRADYAANGIDVGVGTPGNVARSTEAIGGMDAAIIHFNAAQQAFGDEAQAYNYDTQGKVYQTAATGAENAGFFKAGSTLLSSASSLASKAAQFKLSGASY